MSDLSRYTRERMARDPEFAEGLERGYADLKLGVHLREVCEQAGLTQEELVQRLESKARIAMTEIQQIEQAVERLSKRQLAEFRRWFAEFDADAWDEQIEADATAGKLDALADEALAEYHAGKAREL